jgi:hypothetical protein
MVIPRLCRPAPGPSPGTWCEMLHHGVLIQPDSGVVVITLTNAAYGGRCPGSEQRLGHGLGGRWVTPLGWSPGVLGRCTEFPTVVGDRGVRRHECGRAGRPRSGCPGTDHPREVLGGSIKKTRVGPWCAFDGWGAIFSPQRRLGHLLEGTKRRGSRQIRELIEGGRGAATLPARQAGGTVRSPSIHDPDSVCSLSRSFPLHPKRE